MPGSFKPAEELFPERKLREILSGLNPVVHAVAPGDPVSRALALMSEHDIGLVVVLDGERLAGVLSERDLARRAGSAAAGELQQLRVSELMTRDVSTVRPDESFGRCMALMDQRGARHMPVVEAGRVIAVLSVRDLLREAVAQHRRVLAELDRERLMAFQHIG